MKLTTTVLALGLALCMSAPAFAGPQCTVKYPRGFKVLKGTKKRPIRLCVGGDLETTWRNCQERRSA
jgi:hypothetical protein